MMWFRPSCRIAFVSTLLTGCYTAELDSGWSAVFVCEEDLDCALGQACVGGVCLSEEDAVGPTLEVLDPPLLDVFQQGATPERTGSGAAGTAPPVGVAPAAGG